MMESRVFLGATGRRPAVEVLTTPGAERLVFPLPDDDGAFDHAVPREGWVALGIGMSVIGLVDRNWLKPVGLGQSWELVPATDPSLLIVKRDVDDAPEGTVSVEVIDRAGHVLRSVVTSWVNLAGELQDGTLICEQGLLGSDGQLRPLPWDGQPLAVLDGRQVLVAVGNRIEHDGRVVLYDLITGRHRDADLPGTSFLLSPVFDTTAMSVAFHQWDAPWVVVATTSAGIRVLEVGFPQRSAAWIDRDRLLVACEREHVVIDVLSGEHVTLQAIAKDAHPRVDVTDRSDIERLKAAQAPRVVGPVLEDVRERLLGEELARLVEVVGLTGLPVEVIERAVPAVRLRSCIPPRRLRLGASRFGGRPDLPVGQPWPRYDGSPMAFLVQVRCDELAASLPGNGIPEDGLLVVFTATGPDDGAIYCEAVHAEIVSTTKLSRRPWPPGLPQEARFDPSIVSAEPMLSPPNRWELKNPIDDRQAQALAEFTRASGSLHQFMGNPSTVQDVVLDDGERLLLRLDSDPLTGTLYGDGGSLQITIPNGRPFADAIREADVTMDST